LFDRESVLAKGMDKKWRMLHLTQQEQKVVLVLIFLFLTGLAVKSWRAAHPPNSNLIQSSPERSSEAQARP
jgi:hypothetical protein